MPKSGSNSIRKAKVPPAILPEGGDPAVFTTAEERIAILKEIEPPKPPHVRTKNGVRMLQPWRCSNCKNSGEFECFSTDDSLYIWDNILRLHLELSPECHRHKFLVFDNWRTAPVIPESGAPPF